MSETVKKKPKEGTKGQNLIEKLTMIVVKKMQKQKRKKIKK